MSKGSRDRVINYEAFDSNFSQIKWKPTGLKLNDSLSCQWKRKLEHGKVKVKHSKTPKFEIKHCKTFNKNDCGRF